LLPKIKRASKSSYHTPTCAIMEVAIPILTKWNHLVKCAICSNSIESGDRFCGWCGSPQRSLKMQTGHLGKHEIKVFPDEVKDRYIRLRPTGQGEVDIRWELDRDSAGAPWLRIPKTEDSLPVERDSQQRIIVYGGRLPEGSSHIAHLRLHHTTKAGSRLDNKRLWDRWCWDTTRVTLEVLRQSPAYLVADRTERNLGRIAQVAFLPVPQLFRLGNGGHADLHLSLTSSSHHLRLSQSKLNLKPQETKPLSAELHLLDLAVGQEHVLTLSVFSEEDDQEFQFSVRFFLQHPRVELPVLGVDFGTSSSKVALLGEGDIQQVRLDGKDLFPSHLYLHADGRMVIGEEAAEYRGEPNYLRNLKSLLADNLAWVEVLDPATGERIRHDLHALVAGFLRRLFRKVRESEDFERFVGQGVSAADIRLVLTIPAGTSAEARAETEQVMKRILERLGFAEVRILVEPTAVSFLYAAEDPEMIEGKRILVFDCGAGTTDVSLLRVKLAQDEEEGFFFRQFENLGEAGENIGGNLFDVALYDRLVSKISDTSQAKLRRLLWTQQQGSSAQLEPPASFPGKRKLRSQHLLEAIKKTKEELSRRWSDEQPHFAVKCDEALEPDDVLTLSRAELAKTLRHFFDRLEALCARVIRDAQLEDDDIDRVYLVGGSSFLPPVKSLLTRMFGADRVITDTGRLTSISRGAVASASTRIRRVLTVDYVLRVPGLPEQVLVSAGAIYPTLRRTRVFLAPTHPPFLLHFEVFRAPSAKLGNANTEEALLGNVPVRVDYGPSREVTLSYEVDEYGDLTVSAQYRDSSVTKDFPMRYLRPRLSTGEDDNA
jgi:Ethanolamine utilization protein EutJ (predicted chaperonin)